jgi:flavin reductase (DIM6/NTAB) family NADH-FMN oxidoreductase RutF
MQSDIEKMAAMDRYELLLGADVPRPIALVTTTSANGAINAAAGRGALVGSPRKENSNRKEPS